MATLLLTETVLWAAKPTPPHHCVSCSPCWSKARLSPSLDPASQKLGSFALSYVVHNSRGRRRKGLLVSLQAHWELKKQ